MEENKLVLTKEEYLLELTDLLLNFDFIKLQYYYNYIVEYEKE